MSVVGFDVGNENCVVAVARQRGIDVVLNDESKRETPAMVSFGEKQRFLGTAAAGVAMMNPKNTFSQIKRMIGRKFNDPELQKDIPLFPFKVVEGPDGDPVVEANYLGEKKLLNATQLLAALLGNLKAIAETNLEAKVNDCVIGIPVYFTESQRRTYLDAAAIAQLHPLRLMHETTATALAYGIYKTDLPEKDPVNVVFVDVGHASLQVCITAYKKGQLKMLAHAFDRSTGGRDFDEVLFNHFTDEFKTKYQIDVRANTRACMRLRASCEKLKKVLSANPESPLHVECLMEEKDVTSYMNRETFEKLAVPILDRILAPCQRALEESGLTVDKISSVEVVGSGSRVPAVLKILSTFFGKEPSRTMNASECIARGCALQCAMLSPTFRVREFNVEDTFLFPISLLSAGPAAEVEDAQGEQGSKNILVFQKNNPLPSTKMVTFFRSETFTVTATHADPTLLPPGVSPKITTFTIGPWKSSKPEEKSRLKIKFHLNLHGILSVESATLIEEEEVDVPVSAEGAKDATGMETDKPGVDASMDEAEAADAAGSGENGDAPGTTAEEKGEQMDTDQPKGEVLKKKKTKRTDVPVKVEHAGGMLPVELQSASEQELQMMLQDRVMEETKDRKNAVEAYVYEMRNKLGDSLSSYVGEKEKEQLLARLQETEDWLYEDGEDETKGVYTTRLEELRKLGDPIDKRQRENELRPAAIEGLTHCFNSFRDAAQSNKFEHISTEDKDKVVEECRKAEMWLREKQEEQKGLRKTSDPVLLSDDIKKKAEMLDRFCKPIMTKPKPAPARTSSDDAPKPDAGKPEEPPAAGADAMDTDAGDSVSQD